MNPIPIPSDFAAVAPTLYDRELRQRYGRGYRTIQRWCKLCGVKPTRAEIASFGLGVCVRFNIPYLWPYWRVFVIAGIMCAYGYHEFRRLK